MNYADLPIQKEFHFENAFLVSDAESNYYSSFEYPFQQEVYKIIGACMEVHKELGKGFVESVYHEALCIELAERNIPFESNKLLNVYYKGRKLKKAFNSDIFAYDHIIVELKAVEGSLNDHQSQIINYLSATKQGLGLLINFGTPSLQYKRFIISKNLNHRKEE